MGQVIHPGLMFGLFHDWDGRPYEHAPLFYRSVDAETADLLQRLSDEIREVREALQARRQDPDPLRSRYKMSLVLISCMTGVRQTEPP